MYPYSQAVTPAVRTHLEAQTSFLNDVSKSLFRSFQQVCELNIQLVQTMMEETASASQQLLTSERHTDAFGAAASRAQPAADKLRAYQQHLSRVAADAQVDLSRVTEQHVQKTSQTARALADEVARVATEETERGVRKQEENIRQFSDPFISDGKGNQAGARGNSSGGASATMQSGTPGSNSGTHEGADGTRPPAGSTGQAGTRPGAAGRTT